MEWGRQDRASERLAAVFHILSAVREEITSVEVKKEMKFYNKLQNTSDS